MACPVYSLEHYFSTVNSLVSFDILSFFTTITPHSSYLKQDILTMFQVIILNHKRNHQFVFINSSFHHVRFWCRLWLYPQIVLFSTGYVARTILPEANFYFLFNVMLWCLMVLNVYWFHFIIMLIIRVLKGESRTVEDTRSYDTKKKMANGHVSKEKSVNGTFGSNGTYDAKVSKNVSRRNVNGKPT